MQKHYYADTDSLYVDLTDKPSVESQEVAPDVVLDYDDTGQICGIDVDHASENVMNLFTTSAGIITMRLAQAEDVDDILAILSEVGEWLAARGINQWEPGQFSRNGCVPAVERGEVYVAVVDGETVGTLRLLWTEEALWNMWSDSAGYVHKIAVKRSHAGCKIGLGMLDWAERRVASAGRSYLRLDCMAANLDLRNYYLKAGFGFVSEAQIYGFSAALFEREVHSLGIESYLLSESALAKDWLMPEEDEAWEDL